jgi:hypothetical protein
LYTKITKPVLGYLRSQGLLVVGYLDDTLWIANTYKECMIMIQKITALFHKLGFIVNVEKSQLVPS